VLKAQAILEKDYGVAADVWSVTVYKELYRDANDCARVEHAASDAGSEVPYVTKTLKGGASRAFIAASDYMKVLPGGIAQWIPGKLVVARHGCGFGRSGESRIARDFFEVDAKHIVLATLHALAGKNPATRRTAQKL